MLHVVTDQNAHLYRAALREMFEMRYRIFVEQLGWNALRRQDGLERDQFDTPDAIYLLLFDEDETSVIGAHRLLRTTGPHLMSEIFSHTCTRGSIVRGPRVLEASRTCIDEEKIPPHKSRYFHSLLMAGSYEFLVRAQIEKLTGIIALKLLAKYLREEMPFEPLGSPVELDGASYVPVVASIAPARLERVKREARLEGPLVQYFAPQLVDPSIIAPDRRWSPMRLQ